MADGALGPDPRSQQRTPPPQSTSPVRFAALDAGTSAHGRQLEAQATLIIESFTDCRLQLYNFGPLRSDLNKLRAEEKSYGIRLTSPKDGDGHGDTFSAFGLALLVAHEVAGKRPIVAGAVSCDADVADDYILPGDPRSPNQQRETAFEFAQREFELNRQEFDQEMRHFSAPNDDQEPFRQWMRDNTDRLF